MSYGCPICNDKLERRPAGDTQSRGLSATPCGHIFHTFCINQWLSRSSGKHCPCCRKVIDKVNSIFPNGYDGSDSEREGSPQGAVGGSRDEVGGSRCNCRTKINELKKQLKMVEERLKESEDLCKELLIVEDYRKFVENRPNVSEAYSTQKRSFSDNVTINNYSDLLQREMDSLNLMLERFGEENLAKLYHE